MYEVSKVLYCTAKKNTCDFSTNFYSFIDSSPTGPTPVPKKNPSWVIKRFSRTGPGLPNYTNRGPETPNHTKTSLLMTDHTRRGRVGAKPYHERPKEARSYQYKSASALHTLQGNRLARHGVLRTPGLPPGGLRRQYLCLLIHYK